MKKGDKKGVKCGIKKVWNPTANDIKILKFLNDFKEGARANSIKRYCGFKTSTIYKRLNILKNKGIIIDEFPVWKLINGEVKFVESLLENDNSNIFELHNPGYVVKLLEVPKWWNPKGLQMKNRLMMVKGYQCQQVNFGKNNSNPYIQIKNDRYVIQMYPESIIVIHRKRYYSNDPYNLTIEFMNEFYDLWTWFEDRMKFKFFKDGIPQMTLRGHDYNRINDWVSNRIIKRTKKKVLIDIGDGRQVWYDLSEPYGREANTPEMQRMLEDVTKDRVINKPLLPSELQLIVSQSAQQIKEVTDNQLLEARNIIKHQKVLDDMSITLKEIREGLKKPKRKSFIDWLKFKK